MSPPGSKQKPTMFKVQPRPVSPDDVKFLLLERDRLAASDTRTPGQRLMGDPPLERSALAQRNHAQAKPSQ